MWPSIETLSLNHQAISHGLHSILSYFVWWSQFTSLLTHSIWHRSPKRNICLSYSQLYEVSGEWDCNKAICIECYQSNTHALSPPVTWVHITSIQWWEIFLFIARCARKQQISEIWLNSPRRLNGNNVYTAIKRPPTGLWHWWITERTECAASADEVHHKLWFHSHHSCPTPV